MEKLEELSFAELRALKKIIKKEIKKKKKMYWNGLGCILREFESEIDFFLHVKKLTVLKGQIDDAIKDKIYELIYPIKL